MPDDNRHVFALEAHLVFMQGDSTELPSDADLEKAAVELPETVDGAPLLGRDLMIRGGLTREHVKRLLHCHVDVPLVYALAARRLNDKTMEPFLEMDRGRVLGDAVCVNSVDLVRAISVQSPHEVHEACVRALYSRGDTIDALKALRELFAARNPTLMTGMPILRENPFGRSFETDPSYIHWPSKKYFLGPGLNARVVEYFLETDGVVNKSDIVEHGVFSRINDGTTTTYLDKFTISHLNSIYCDFFNPHREKRSDNDFALAEYLTKNYTIGTGPCAAIIYQLYGNITSQRLLDVLCAYFSKEGFGVVDEGNRGPKTDILNNILSRDPSLDYHALTVFFSHDEWLGALIRGNYSLARYLVPGDNLEELACRALKDGSPHSLASLMDHGDTRQLVSRIMLVDMTRIADDSPFRNYLCNSRISNVFGCCQVIIDTGLPLPPDTGFFLLKKILRGVRSVGVHYSTLERALRLVSADTITRVIDNYPNISDDPILLDILDPYLVDRKIPTRWWLGWVQFSDPSSPNPFIARKYPLELEQYIEIATTKPPPSNGTAMVTLTAYALEQCHRFAPDAADRLLAHEQCHGLAVKLATHHNFHISSPVNAFCAVAVPAPYREFAKHMFEEAVKRRRLE